MQDNISVHAGAGKNGSGRNDCSQGRRALGTLPLLLLVLPLAGCISDGAAFHIDGKEHSLSLVREQRFPWDRQLDLYVVASRMPDCQRRHKLRPASADGLSIEVFAVDDRTWHLRQGARMYRVETQSCEGFQQIEKVPEGNALGTPAGRFATIDGAFRFVPAPAPAAPAKPAG